VLTPVQAPNANAYAERFVRSIREECLDRLILFGERRLLRTLDEFITHYHGERNHQGLGNRLIAPGSAGSSAPTFDAASGWADCCATITAPPELWDEFSDTTRAARQQIAVQDRVDAVLQTRPVLHDACAPGDLTAHLFGQLIRAPDFWQKAGGVQASQDGRVDLVRLDLRCRDGTRLQRVREHHAPDVLPEESRDRVGVAGGFEDDIIVLRELAPEGVERLGREVDAACRTDAALVQYPRWRSTTVRLASRLSSALWT
jgi:hypothetical protein